MAKYIALLRGINVGKAKRVGMAELRELFAGLGFKDVKTLLNSGNVIFSGKAPSETRIEKAFEEKFGFGSRITIVDGDELAAAVRENPLPENPNPSRFLVAFLKTAEHRTRLIEFESGTWHPEAFGLGTRVAYMWCPEGVLASPLATAVSKALKDSVTVRNWATVLKLYELVK